MHPGYLEILKTYSEDQKNCNYQSLHMTSNVSAGLGWFKKYVETTKDINRVSVTASYHKEFTTKDLKEFEILNNSWKNSGIKGREHETPIP